MLPPNVTSNQDMSEEKNLLIQKDIKVILYKNSNFLE